MVAVWCEGPSLTVLATVFRVNKLEGERKRVLPLQKFEAENFSAC